ncbi:HipA domain-containing protein [Galbitalea soli]|uniref:Type II toxin-antitoxin system HipA family toxin n=1 Tax=Galbitalea soli TaxID=1268042 RepID=A0A7C9PMI8_9MICO|nr:HipA domain-containing protein [Galbitalea soli]NEM90811.1 type II toxin-antitoxin system HipA family toxin [Galbitalea soli]NYJ31529.1 serine/threonine-protein kinase HipA [Galbitalea soli]
MSERLDVFLYGYPVGTLRRDGIELYVFDYDGEWATSDETTSLSLSMPLAQRTHSGRVVANFVDNLLPDNPEVRQRWATDAGLDSDEPFFLLQHYGQDVAGAISFRAPGAEAAGSRSAISDAEIAERIRQLTEDDTAWHDDRIATDGQFSLGGTQTKFSLAKHGSGWFETVGDDPSTHLFKPRVKGVPDGELIEFVVMRAAELLGIPTARVDLFIDGDQHSLVVERFDRIERAGDIIRLHQEDLVQSLGLPRLRKFESHGGPGIDRIMGLLRASSDQESRIRYAVLLMFSWLVLSTDAHAKNYSVFLQPDGAILTPLYDASSVIPYLSADRDTDVESILRRAGERKLAVRYGASYLAKDVARFELDAIARAAGMPGDDLLAATAVCLTSISATISEVATSLPAELQTDTVARLVAWMPVRVEQAARALGIDGILG